MLYDAANALLAMIRVCMGGDACDYDTFVSLGAPPAVCNSIAAHWDYASRDDESSDDCQSVTDDNLMITITRCCGERETFDPAAEDADAKCFLEDLYIMKTCITCNASSALSPYTHANPKVEEIMFDDEKDGGCYSATIRISMSEMQCCPPPPPSPIP